MTLWSNLSSILTKQKMNNKKDSPTATIAWKTNPVDSLNPIPVCIVFTETQAQAAFRDIPFPEILCLRYDIMRMRLCSSMAEASEFYRRENDRT